MSERRRPERRRDQWRGAGFACPSPRYEARARRRRSSCRRLPFRQRASGAGATRGARRCPVTRRCRIPRHAHRPAGGRLAEALAPCAHLAQPLHQHRFAHARTRRRRCRRARASICSSMSSCLMGVSSASCSSTTLWTLPSDQRMPATGPVTGKKRSFGEKAHRASVRLFELQLDVHEVVRRPGTRVLERQQVLVPAARFLHPLVERVLLRRARRGTRRSGSCGRRSACSSGSRRRRA